MPPLFQESGSAGSGRLAESSDVRRRDISAVCEDTGPQSGSAEAVSAATGQYFLPVVSGLSFTDPSLTEAGGGHTSASTRLCISVYLEAMSKSPNS